MKPTILIGIDPGVKTGLAVWDAKGKVLVRVESMTILGAMKIVQSVTDDIIVRFEDARKRNWFGKAGREKLQGAGSIKRDSSIWEEFLESSNIPYEAVAPKNNKTKLDAKTFKKVTGWNGRTDEHGRDAAMLVYGR